MILKKNDLGGFAKEGCRAKRMDIEEREYRSDNDDLKKLLHGSSWKNPNHAL